jgi:autotransporter-associated beta strand protein
MVSVTAMCEILPRSVASSAAVSVRFSESSMASRQSAFRLFAALSIALALAAGAAIPAHAQIAWTNYTTGSGLGNNSVYGVYAQGSTIYAATNNGGLSVSANNGTNWTTYTTGSGLGNNVVPGVYASGSTIYAATYGGGLSVSANNGTNWTNYTIASGLGSNNVNGVYASGSTIYAATGGGLSVSANNGANWTTYTTGSGLGSNSVLGVYASGSRIYAATYGGLSVSTNNGTNWTTYTTGSGLGSNNVNGVYASGSTIYAATYGGLGVSANNGTSWTTYTSGSGLGNNSVFGVYASGSTIYAATFGGLSVGVIPPPPPPTSVTLDATSGTGTIATNYSTTTGAAGLTLSNGFFAEYLAVGGGGSGGTPGGDSSNQNNWSTGGGGGGGMLTGTSQLSATSYAVTVGGGGAAPAYNSGSTSRGNNGANSVFGSGTAVGGGGGGGGENSFSGVGASGGSGGGGGSKYDNAGGTGTTDQGNPGGAARNGNESTAGNRTAGGGGGGAGGVGGTPVANSSNGGNGGVGLASTITGSSVRYAGGGGGGAYDTYESGETAGTGGAGGGGAGSTSGTATAGTDGLGGGGGGRGVGGVGGQGGSGVVIVRYQGASLGAIGGTVTSGSGSAAGYTLHTFTTTGTTTGTSALNVSGVDMNARLGVTLTGAISGTGGLTFAGPGRLTLAAENTFTGDTRISSGTLAISNQYALAGSTLDMNASDSGSVTFSQDSTLGGLKGSRTLANGGRRLSIGDNNQSTTYSGNLSGAGGLTKTGNGTLTLSGSNSFTGSTLVLQGTLAVANANALAGSTLDVEGSDNTTFSQDSSIGGLRGFGGLNNGGYTLTIGGNNANETWAPDFYNFDPGIYGSGALIKNGNGTLTLAGPNTFTGDTRVASGSLTIADRQALLNSTLDMNASDSGAVTFAQDSALGGLKGSRNLANGGNTLSIGGNNQSTTYSGVLSGSGGLTKLGEGTLALSGNNTYTGPTTVSMGTLAIGSGGTTGAIAGNIANSSVVVFNRSDAVTYAGTISGNGSLTKQGGSSLTLTGNNTYSGLTTVSGGTLAIGAGGTSGAIAGNIANSGAVVFNRSDAATYAGVISGTGGLTKQGAGTLSLTGNNTYLGQTTVSAGTLAIGAGGTTGAIAGNIANSGAVVFNRSDAITYSGTISGSGSLTKDGAGTLSLTGNNTYSGLTTVSGGTLAIGAGGTTGAIVGDIANSGAVVFNRSDSVIFYRSISGIGSLTKQGAGTLELRNDNTYSGLTTVSSGTLQIGNGYTAGSIAGDIANFGAVVFNRSDAVTYAGMISGTGSLIKRGSGTLTLSGSSSFTGDTRFYFYNSGKLAIANVNALAGSTLDPSFDHDAFVFLQDSNIGGLKGSSNITNGGYTLTIGGNNQSTTYSGRLSGSGGLIKNGTGMLTLSNVNTFTGDTRIASGTLAIGNANALYQSTLDMNASDSGAITFSQASNISGLKGSRNLANGGYTLAIGGNNQSTTYSGGLSGSGGLTKVGTGTLTLAGSNSYTGDTRASTGGLVIANAGALAGSTLDMNWRDGGTIAFSQDSNIGGLKGSGSIINGGYTLTIGGNNGSTTYDGQLAGSGGLTKSGTGTLTLSNRNNFAGDTRIASGTLAIGYGIALNQSTLDMNANDSGAINFSQASTLGGLKGSRGIDNGGNTLTIGGNNASTTYSGVLSGTGGLTKNGTGTLSLTGNNTYSGLTTVSKGTLSVGEGGASGSLVSAVNLRRDTTSLVFNRSDASTYAGNITGAGSLTKLGAGTLTLTGSSDFTGDTTVSAGTLVLGSGNALSSRAAVTVASGATLEATAPIRIFYIDSQGTVVGGENLTATATVTRSGNIGGIADGTDSQGTFEAGIVKLDTGTSTVNAVNTYTGLTWVRAGTLVTSLANAFAAASDLQVDSGATFDRAGHSQTFTDAVVDGIVGDSAIGGLLTVTGMLSGTGVLNGDVLVNGVHAPGNSPGIQTFNGNLSYGSGATINWELIDNTASNSPVVFDQIVLAGLADLAFGGSNVLALSFAGAGSLVDWTNSFWDVNRAWTVFDLATGVTTGFGNLSLGGSLLDGNGLALDAGTRGYFSLALIGQDVLLQYTAVAVPEPSTTAMALAGLAYGGYTMWRRRKRA